MIEFNFKSQPATTIEQSERLIALGLRKETADMTHHYLHSTDSYELKDIEFSRIMHLQELVNKKPVLGKSGDDLYAKDIPAWSLGRLLGLIKHSDICNYNDFGCIKLYIDLDDFETCITMISYMVKDGYFNKGYLV